MTWLDRLGMRVSPHLVGNPSRRTLHLVIVAQTAVATAAIFIQPPIAAFGAVLITMISAITTNQMSNRPWSAFGWRGIFEGLRWTIPAIVVMCLIFYVALTVILNTPPKPV